MSRTERVALFVQCIVDGLYPEVAEATVRILDRLGIRVDCPTDQTCCGQPAYNAGRRREARIAATRFLEIFGNAPAIVCPSGSCVHMVRHQYPDLLSDDSEWHRRAIAVASKTFELSEYLTDVLGVEDLGTHYEARVTYHDSCKLARGLGIREQPRRLIRKVTGIEFVEMKDSDRCCGFGGSFSFKYPEISTAVLEAKVRDIEDSGADIVVSCDMGCLMNIQGMLSRRNSPIKVMHLAQLLAG